MQGNTAVYQLYAHARIASIVRKSGEAPPPGPCYVCMGACDVVYRLQPRQAATALLLLLLLVPLLLPP